LQWEFHFLEFQIFADFTSNFAQYVRFILYYSEEANGTSQIDFLTAKRVPPKGHVIAVRITGENPDEGFKPTRLTWPNLSIDFHFAVVAFKS
jgi:biotin carboxylase